MNSLLDRLSIGAAALAATAAVANLDPVARIVPLEDGVEVVIGLRAEADAPLTLAALVGALRRSPGGCALGGEAP